MGELFRAIDETTGRVIATKVRIARDYKSRSVGLLNRVSMDKGEGLLIKPCNSIHTFFMKFPIDVVFLDKSSKVVKIVSNLMPWRLSSCMLRGHMTLELPCGSIKEYQVSIGSIVIIE